ncbi:MAG: potassium channel protein [Candidatus Aminicenantes bacterium]|nr:potassium channel protein [Candidatus Aminicenantes bacterium]
MTNRQKLIAAILLFLGVFSLGVVGFKYFGGPEATLLDSIYMTAITISTIGYGEAIDLSHNPTARVFTIFFIILSLGSIAFAVSSITAFIVEGELKDIIRRRKMDKEISRLKDHYIVCGSDETAQTVIQELLLTRRKFVVIEPSREKLEKLQSLGHFPYIEGEPSEDEILLKAGIKQARGILLSLPSDELNLYVTLTARSLNPRLRIVSKGIDLKSHAKMKKAGADSVISPTFIGGMRMVSEMIRPSVTTFLDMMLRDKEKVLRVEEVTVKADSKLVGQTLQESRLKERSDILLVAIKKAASGEYQFNPPGDYVITAGDVLIFIGSPEAVQNLEKITA